MNKHTNLMCSTSPGNIQLQKNIYNLGTKLKLFHIMYSLSERFRFKRQAFFKDLRSLLGTSDG